MNYENNVLRLLDACAARDGRWLSTSSCAEYSRIEYHMVRKYLDRDEFEGTIAQIAEFYGFDYRIKKVSRTHFLSVIRIGWT